MNTRCMNYINIKLSRLENRDRRYNIILCNSLRLAEYNQLPSILNNLFKDVRGKY